MSTFYSGVIKVTEIVLMSSKKARDKNHAYHEFLGKSINDFMSSRKNRVKGERTVRSGYPVPTRVLHRIPSIRVKRVLLCQD